MFTASDCDMQMNRLLIVVVLSGCSGEFQSDFVGGASTASDGGTIEPQFFFRPTIQSDLSSVGCLSSSCHGGGNVPMQLSASPADDSEWQANYQEVTSRSGNLIAKCTGAGGHIAPLADGDPMLQRFQEWVDLGAPYEAADMGDPGGEPDAAPPANPAGLTWNTGIYQMLVDDGCVACHGVQGAYSLETYEGALGFGTDQKVPNIVPGDASSLLISYYEDQEHTASPNIAVIREWIVEKGASE